MKKDVGTFAIRGIGIRITVVYILHFFTLANLTTRTFNGRWPNEVQNSTLPNYSSLDFDDNNLSAF